MNTKEKILAAFDAWQRMELRSRPQANLQEYDVSDWHDLTLEKATNEGYLKNLHVFIAVELRAKLLSSIPIIIVNNEGEKLDDHRLVKLIDVPNSQYSFSEMLRLLSIWYDLVGDAYLFKSMVGRNTEELWPISPIELDVRQKTKGIPGEIEYLKKGSETLHPDYNPENMIRIYNPNPANLVTGVSPLEVIGSQVDIATMINEYNETLIGKKGTLDFVVEYPEGSKLSAPQLEAEQKRADKQASGKHTTSGVWLVDRGGKVKVLNKTAEELGFHKTQEAGRNQIFTAYGANAKVFGYDVQSYASQREVIKWYVESAILPEHQKFVAALNRSLKFELGDAHFTADLSNVKMLRATSKERIEESKSLWDMGVPLNQLNEIYQLGIDEFDGWDKSYSGQNQQATQTEIRTIEKKNECTCMSHERASAESKEFERDTFELSEIIRKFLKKEKVAIRKALTENNAPLPEILREAQKRQTKMFDDMFERQAIKYGFQLINTGRNFDSEKPHLIRSTLIEKVEDAISQFIVDEKVGALTSALVSKTTTDNITNLLDKAISEEWSITEISNSLSKSAAFSSARSLMIARTVNGTARSMGQFIAAKESGAEFKRWDSSEDKLVREQHIKFDRQGWIPIDEVWTYQGDSLRFPGDMRANNPLLIVNCRCAMTFK